MKKTILGRTKPKMRNSQLAYRLFGSIVEPPGFFLTDLATTVGFAFPLFCQLSVRQHKRESWQRICKACSEGQKSDRSEGSRGDCKQMTYQNAKHQVYTIN